MNWRVVSPDWCIFAKRIASMLGIERSEKAEGAEAAIFIEMFPGMIEEALRYKHMPKICWWTGTDVKVYLSNTETYDFGNTAHVTDTPTLIYQLSKKVHPVCFLPMPCSIDSSQPPPYPKDPAILMHLYNHQGRDLNRSIDFIKFNRDIPFYIVSSGAAPVIGTAFQDNVFPVAFMKDEERIDLFKKISALIHFVHYDGMSQLIIEMKCLGRHVVTSHMAPYCELVEPEYTPREISIAVRELIKLPPDEAGREWYRTVFSEETFKRIVGDICSIRKWNPPWN